MPRWYVAQVYAEWFRNASSCPYYYWYHSFYVSYALYFYWRFLFFIIFSADVLITFLSSWISASINIHFYVSLSWIRMSGLLLGMVLSVCIWFHHVIILLSWLVSTNFGTCLYQCSLSEFTPIALHMVKFSWEHTLLNVSFNIFWASLYIWETQNTPIRIVPLWNYTLFLVTVKVLETLLEVIMWKSFKLFRRILNDVSSRPFNAYFSRGRGNGQKSAADRSGVYGWCSSVVTLFFNKKFLTKTDRCAGAMKWRRNQLFFLHFWAFLPDRIPLATKDFIILFFICSFTISIMQKFL